MQKSMNYPTINFYAMELIQILLKILKYKNRRDEIKKIKNKQ